MSTSIINTLPVSQAAQLYNIGQEKRGEQRIAPFNDAHEHLESLEHEASILVGMSYIRNIGHSGSLTRENVEDDFFSFMQVSRDSATMEKITEKYQSIRDMNRLREATSEKCGIHLTFNSFCSAYGLSEFERNVLMILLMLYTSRDFGKVVELCGYKEENGKDGMKIGSILSIICSDFRDRLSSRYHFSLDGRLVSKELIVFLGNVDKTTNILNERICIHERVARKIIGDNNIYHSMFTYIGRETSDVKLDMVVMPEKTREELLVHTGSFLKNKLQKKDFLDDFFSYGTGLAFLFHGPSGTGKTMLARGLANHFNCQIFSLNAKNLNTIPGSYEEIFNTLFKEATLQNGIVFFDEADDLFQPDSYISRAMLIEIEKSRCITIFSTNKVVELDPSLERRISMKVYFPFPDENTRHELWKRLIPENIDCSPDVDFGELAERYIFTGGIIKNTIFLAVTSMLNRDGNKKPILTKSALINAAELQAEKMFNDSHICRTYSPQISIADLPLGDKQKKEISGIGSVYVSLKKEKLGFNILICSRDIETGRAVAQGLAHECRLKIREFDFYKIFSSSSDLKKVLDPISQREIKPLEYAFSRTTGDPVMNVFLDYSGYFSTALKVAGENDLLVTIEGFLAELRHNENLFCMITLPMKTETIPIEFNLLLDLKYPPEEMQTLFWRKYLAKGKVTDDELKEIVKQYPMHSTEIEFIGRQALIQSMIKSNTDGLDIKEVREVITRYRRKQKSVELLFGARC